MNVYKITVTADVLETANATRRVEVDGQVLTFGREPVYLRVRKYPPELLSDLKLRVEQVESVPSGAVVIELKAERVQQPTAGKSGPDAEQHLKAERVQSTAGKRR